MTIKNYELSIYFSDGSLNIYKWENWNDELLNFDRYGVDTSIANVLVVKCAIEKSKPLFLKQDFTTHYYNWDTIKEAILTESTVK